jgi:hypothetical protein
MKMNISILGNWLLILATLYFGYQLITVSAPWIFLDNLNLLIHEAGHLIFFTFGDFIRMLGGSLFQILFPFAFLIYFLLRKDYFSVSFILFWVADNIINVSVYMRDAQLMQLPLLGGDTAIHDWNWLFTDMNILPQTQLIGTTFFILGTVCMITGILGMILFTLLKMLNKQILGQSRG